MLLLIFNVSFLTFLLMVYLSIRRKTVYQPHLIELITFIGFLTGFVCLVDLFFIFYLIPLSNDTNFRYCEQVKWLLYFKK